MASALLSYMLLSGLFGRRNLYGVDLHVDFPQEIYAGRSTAVKVTITNKSRWIPAFLVEVSLGEKAALFPFVDTRSSQHRYVDLLFPRRGLHRVDSVYIASIFPFNFFTRFRQTQEAVELTVLPEPRRCDRFESSSQRRVSRDAESSNNIGFESDIISIRDYISGDSMRHISWKSTAKTGHLKTKEFSTIEQEHVMINFDRMKKPQLEMSISCVTFIILKLIRSNIPVGLIIDGEIYKPHTSRSHKICMLRKLALYGQN